MLVGSATQGLVERVCRAVRMVGEGRFALLLLLEFGRVRRRMRFGRGGSAIENRVRIAFRGDPMYSWVWC